MAKIGVDELSELSYLSQLGDVILEILIYGPAWLDKWHVPMLPKSDWVSEKDQVILIKTLLTNFAHEVLVHTGHKKIHTSHSFLWYHYVEYIDTHWHWNVLYRPPTMSAKAIWAIELIAGASLKGKRAISISEQFNFMLLKLNLYVTNVIK